MVKGRTGQRVRLYVRGSILGFKRSKSNQYENTSLMRPLPPVAVATRLWIRIIGCASDEARRLPVGRWAAGDGSASPDAPATRLWIRIRRPPLFPLLEPMCYSLACAWPFSWIGRRWLKEDAAAARSSPAPPADTVAVWYPRRKPPRRRGVQYYSSPSISIARTDILNVSRSASSMELATGAMELATGFCHDGCCLLGFAWGLLHCAYVLLPVIIFVPGFLPCNL
ncbi:hypothetical protein ZWY2020_013562 [Hordeum vulgare]|nr:hypothetical protein ZWY2020_013562 [Hordeum vulgare]